MKNRALITFLSLILSPAFAFCQQIDTTAATVKLTKLEIVSLSALRIEIARFQKLYSSQNRAFTDKERSDILWKMIDVVLFRQAAEKEHIAVSDAQIKATIEQQRQAYSAQIGHDASETELQEYVKASGQNWDDYVKSMKDQLLVQLYVSKVKAIDLQNTTAPSSAELEYYYLTNIQQFVMSEIIEFKHIFINLQNKTGTAVTEAKTKIDNALSRIKGGESFESIATAISEDNVSKNQGGYAGFLRLDSPQTKVLGEEFIEGILAIKEGQFSNVLKSNVGYHIVKVIRIIPAKLYGIDEKVPPYYQQTVGDSIRSSLKVSQQQNTFSAAIESVKNDLRKSAEINIKESVLGFTLAK